jgi:hypothetical protein
MQMLLFALRINMIGQTLPQQQFPNVMACLRHIELRRTPSIDRNPAHVSPQPGVLLQIGTNSPPNNISC